MAIGILIMLALALAFVLFFNLTQKKILKEQMTNQKLAFTHQEELLFKTILIQEEERKRIAKDLHDDIGSKLNVIFLNMHRLSKYKGENKEIGEISSEVNSLINTTIESTRRISHDLLPPTLEEFGIIEALKELIEPYNHSEALSIKLDVVGEGKTLDNEFINLNLFRIFQELIKNSVSHGKSSEIEIKFMIDNSNIEIGYRDNGTGFNIGQSSNNRGIGMKSIKSRINMIHAKHRIISSLGNGFQMVLKFVNSKSD